MRVVSKPDIMATLLIPDHLQPMRVGGVGVGRFGTRPWWLALLACGGAYWPLALEPSAMTSRRPYYCGHPRPPAGGGGSRMQLLPMASSPDGLISAWYAVITKTPGWEVLTTTQHRWGGGGVMADWGLCSTTGLQLLHSRPTSVGTGKGKVPFLWVRAERQPRRSPWQHRLPAQRPPPAGVGRPSRAVTLMPLRLRRRSDGGIAPHGPGGLGPPSVPRQRRAASVVRVECTPCSIGQPVPQWCCTGAEGSCGLAAEPCARG